MTRLAADYSWSRPDLATLKRLGYEGIIRYLSWDDSKNLTVDEVQRAHSLGLWVALNWEGHGNWSEFSTGAIGGQAAGAHAAQLAGQLGAPADVGIFVSADYQATRDQWPTIGQFLDGFAKASGRPVDFYGQGDLGDWLVANGHARHVWNTNATSWGGVSSRAVIRQRLWADVAGGQIDPNEVVGNPADWAWMPPGATSTPTPSPQEDDDMNRADTIALLRAPEFSQAKTRAQVDALAKQVAEIRDEQKATNLMLEQLTTLIKGIAAK
jgi:hypothetical protein